MNRLNYEVDIKKAVIWGIVLLIISMVIMSVAYQNPLVSGIYHQYQDHSSFKPAEEVGGMGMWMFLMFTGSAVFDAVFIILFLMVHPRLPGNGIQKGLFWGLIYWIFRALPEGLNQYLLFNYPVKLIWVSIINGFIMALLLGLIMGIIFEKMKVVKYS
jgi:MFS superfamily sulfate permease-like transporter